MLDAVSLQPLIGDLFESITLHDVRALAATVAPRSDGRFDVTLSVSARKVRADGAGNESDVPFDGWVEPGTLDAQRQATLLEQRRGPAGRSQVTLTIDQRPTSAGIDPLGGLIDRDVSVDVVRVSR